jgi:hypothetical protein
MRKPRQGVPRAAEAMKTTKRMMSRPHGGKCLSVRGMTITKKMRKMSR